MILSALRLLRSLSGYHYRTIILTVLLPILLPTLFSLAISYFELDLVLKILLHCDLHSRVVLDTWCSPWPRC